MIKPKSQGDGFCTRDIELEHHSNGEVDTDTFPIAALEQRYEALQEHTSDNEEFLELLIAVSTTDAQRLRRGLRQGEEIPSLIALGKDMRRMNDR